MLSDCQQRGPRLAMAPRAFGRPQVWPTMRGQRCWVHKTERLDKLPTRQQPQAERMICDIDMAPTRWSDSRSHGKPDARGNLVVLSLVAHFDYLSTSLAFVTLALGPLMFVAVFKHPCSRVDTRSESCYRAELQFDGHSDPRSRPTLPCSLPSHHSVQSMVIWVGRWPPP